VDLEERHIRLLLTDIHVRAAMEGYLSASRAETAISDGWSLPVPKEMGEVGPKSPATHLMPRPIQVRGESAGDAHSDRVWSRAWWDSQWDSIAALCHVLHWIHMDRPPLTVAEDERICLMAPEEDCRVNLRGADD